LTSCRERLQRKALLLKKALQVPVNQCYKYGFYKCGCIEITMKVKVNAPAFCSFKHIDENGYITLPEGATLNDVY
jgi:3'-phosphoadenosine 5'-phosphosulfate sulfotransferase (PAPS reductase)/FAD synthetase